MTSFGYNVTDGFAYILNKTTPRRILSDQPFALSAYRGKISVARLCGDTLLFNVYNDILALK